MTTAVTVDVGAASASSVGPASNTTTPRWTSTAEGSTQWINSSRSRNCHPRRRVPITAILRDFLAEHLARARARAGSERLFGTTGIAPFDPQRLQARADRAWRAAGLDRITPHGCRHTFASLMIAAGVGAKHLQTYLGHSSVATTLDIYGHLMPGSEAEAAGLLDDYFTAQRERAEDAARAGIFP